MSEAKRVEFLTRDGVTLRGDFFQAKGDKRPVLVMLGGFSLLKELTGRFAPAFVEAGFSCLAYDNRTFGSSDGMPRQQIDLYQQAEDFKDAVTAAMTLPGVDKTRVVMWGVGHGATAAMMAGGDDPRLKAVVMQAPFPSGALDQLNFPKDILSRAWKEREQMARGTKPTPTYAKVFRDWEAEGDGDEATVFIKGIAGLRLMQGNKALADAAGTPWKNEITLQSFLNTAGCEAQDFAYKIHVPALYMVNEDDPFAAPPSAHQVIYSRMGGNVEFRVMPKKPGGVLQDQLDAGIQVQIAWLHNIL